MEGRSRSLRDVPSGTWLVLIVAANFAIIGLGNLISNWSRLMSDLSTAVVAFIGALLPVVALAWGVHLARRTGPRRLPEDREVEN